jgi:DNA-binding transcriptional MocR family regulator
MAFSERVSRLKSSLIREILAAAQRPEVMSFAGGLPAEAMLPKVEWDDMPLSIGQYGMSEGEPALREALAAEARALGWRAGEPGAGGQRLQQTLDLAAKLYIDKGTEILLEAPTYLAALQIFQLFGADCLTVPQEADGPTWPAAQSSGTTPPGVHLPDPDVPESIGRALQRSQARCRRGVARRVRRDPDRRRTLPRTDLRRRQCHAGRLKKASWIYTGTVSKTLLPGLRVGYLIASPDLFPHLLKLKQSADLHTNRVGQWQALQWIGSEKYQQHLVNCATFTGSAAMRFRRRWKRIFRPGGLEHAAGRAVFWLTLKQPLDTRTLLNEALANDVAFMPGEPFFPIRTTTPGIFV